MAGNLVARLSLVAIGVGLAAAGGCGLSSVGDGVGGAIGGTGGVTLLLGAGGRRPTPAVGGVGGAMPGTCAGAVPSTALIDDFSGGGIPHGAPYTFMDPGLTPPVVDTSSGAMEVTILTGVPTTMYPYVGFGVPFGSCFDLTGYVGVQFTISGTLSAGCVMQFSLLDAAHYEEPFGVCTGICYPPAKAFDLTGTPTPVTAFFSSDFFGGGPAEPVVPSAALGVQWQIDVPTGDTGGCAGDVIIDDVYLISGGPPPP